MISPPLFTSDSRGSSSPGDDFLARGLSLPQRSRGEENEAAAECVRLRRGFDNNGPKVPLRFTEGARLRLRFGRAADGS